MLVKLKIETNRTMVEIAGSVKEFDDWIRSRYNKKKCNK